ncbi:hypothetical protein BU14_0022s0007 [Porphyra umbilicalis]|uniref:Uncharacterized protein n=1 Tax=Porphyra umbilicalis TaxID=2786 RepID=A0A1X6PKJ6_PORUM|nr:hypothetical protein BU14_0022s0007 [Porphyra umbilicalis]|eukprot:OSX81286.1 hypothetical protein BU14_0022s0007 [Porphyra umbilicalis]
MIPVDMDQALVRANSTATASSPNGGHETSGSDGLLMLYRAGSVLTAAGSPGALGPVSNATNAADDQRTDGGSTVDGPAIGSIRVDPPSAPPVGGGLVCAFGLDRVGAAARDQGNGGGAALDQAAIGGVGVGAPHSTTVGGGAVRASGDGGARVSAGEQWVGGGATSNEDATCATIVGAAPPPPGVDGTPVDSDLSGARSRSLRSTVPLPFVRKMRLHMDSCPSTNKSQFFFCGLGMLLACGILDCAQVLYMVVGHTEFGPDLVARSLTGIFNRSDVKNHGQLVRLFRAYSTAGAYDETILRTWKEATKTIFSPILRIMSYRCILLLADDGEVSLGSPAKPPTNFDPFPDAGPLFGDDIFKRECTKAAARGLKSSVFPALTRGAYRGIGRDALGNLSDATNSMLLPSAVSSYRSVRLFTRRSIADPLWREQLGWMTATTAEQVNSVLDNIKPYGMEQNKLPYGAKADSVAKMYEKIVPRRFVPDTYAVSDAGPSGMARAVWKQKSLAPTSTEQSTKPSVALDETGADGHPRGGDGGRADDGCLAPGRAKRMRWVKLLHAKPLEDILLAAPYSGQLPPALKDWKDIAAKMPKEGSLEWESATLNRHGRAIAKTRENLLE